MHRSLLLPLDGSTFAESALPVAAAIARQSGALLNLARVRVGAPEPQHEHAHAPVSADGPEEEPAIRQRGGQSESEYLTAIASRIAGTGVRATTQLLEGPSVGSLIAYADSIDADLVVIATHARGLWRVRGRAVSRVAWSHSRIARVCSSGPAGIAWNRMRIVYSITC